MPLDLRRVDDLLRHSAAPIVGFVLSIVLVVNACGPQVQSTATVHHVGRANPYPIDLVKANCAMVDSSMGGGRIRALMDTLHWLPGCVPMFTDDQRLNGGDALYGPLAHAATVPSDTFSVLAKFDVSLPNAIWVGVVTVDTSDGAVLPESYAKLNLKPGSNCIFLRHESGQPQTAGWHAYVTTLSGADVCDPPTTEQALTVFAIQNASFSDTSDYPPIARFHETHSNGNKHRSMVGLKCVAAFCLVAPAEVSGNPNSEHFGVHGQRGWQVFGWGDEQHVGLQGASGHTQPQWDFNASIIPSDDLGEKHVSDFDANEVFAATIFLKKDPPAGSKYDRGWHLKKGENYIFARHAGADPAAGWSAVIRQTFSPTAWDKLLAALHIRDYEWPLNITRKTHGDIVIPGTARFRWSEADEEGWFRCDNGCCQADGYEI